MNLECIYNVYYLVFNNYNVNVCILSLIDKYKIGYINKNSRRFFNKFCAFRLSSLIWRSSSLSELTLIIINMGLSH